MEAIIYRASITENTQLTSERRKSEKEKYSKAKGARWREARQGSRGSYTPRKGECLEGNDGEDSTGRRRVHRNRLPPLSVYAALSEQGKWASRKRARTPRTPPPSPCLDIPSRRVHVSRQREARARGREQGRVEREMGKPKPAAGRGEDEDSAGVGKTYAHPHRASALSARAAHAAPSPPSSLTRPSISVSTSIFISFCTSIPIDVHPRLHRRYEDACAPRLHPRALLHIHPPSSTGAGRVRMGLSVESTGESVSGTSQGRSPRGRWGGSRCMIVQHPRLGQRMRRDGCWRSQWGAGARCGAGNWKPRGACGDMYRLFIAQSAILPRLAPEREGAEEDAHSSPYSALRVPFRARKESGEMSADEIQDVLDTGGGRGEGRHVEEMRRV
ncbi:hypothetical protein B0H13DRAFT_1923658 [Mycena leptocephala]|nr:hypothetical protein B0H13DRAFT_1923658 [Mycena leptocephala]